MKIKTITLALILPFMVQNSFGQFTGDKDGSFGTSGQLWYDWTGGGATTFMTKLVLDENSESFYFSGSLNAAIVKASMDGELSEDLPEGTINYDPFIGLDDRFESVAVQENGKMVGVGYSIMGLGNSDIIITRFEEDGTFDATFNGGAPMVLDEGGLDFASDVVIQDDGKIVVIGSYQTTPSDLDLFFLRLNSDGTPDGTFGLGGVQVLDTYDGIELIHSVTILENGNIAAVGQAGTDVLVVELDEEGNFDSDFSIDGSLNFKVNSLPSVATTLIELEGGDLLLGGNTISEEDDGNASFVIKMQANGNFILDFNDGDGKLDLKFEEGESLDTTFTLKDMEVFENGQILVAGDYHTDTDDLGLVLINEDGTIDTEFGTDGMRLYNLSGGSLPTFDSQIEIASNGRVYLAGRVVNGDFEDVVTWRLYANYTGIDEIAQSDIQFNLYPNPATNELNLTAELDPSSEEISIQIVDFSGKVLVMKNYDASELEGGNLSLNEEIDALPQGLYKVVFLTESGMGSKTFMKK